MREKTFSEVLCQLNKEIAENRWNAASGEKPTASLVLVTACMKRLQHWANASNADLFKKNRRTRKFASGLALTSGCMVTYDGGIEKQALEADKTKRDEARILLAQIKQDKRELAKVLYDLKKHQRSWFPL